MIFPESQRETYRQNPLKEVICQLRFPTILRIAAEPPAEFQERVRADYPLYTSESPTETLPKEINELLAGVPFPFKSVKQSSVHKFETESRTRLISLSKDFLALSEKDYREWSDFRRELERAEAAIRQEYTPAFYERIGLRYQNVIDKELLCLDDHSWSDLLKPSLLGLLGANETGTLESRTQTLVKLPEPAPGYVRIRHGLAVSNDRPVYTIDSDFFVEERSQPENAFTILDEFNRVASRFFRWAISPRLRDAMGPMAIAD